MRRRHPTIQALLISAAVLALAGSTSEGAAGAAVLCPAELADGGDGAPLAGLDARVRLTWIDARLGEAGHHARVWAWGWGLGIGASGVASLIAVPFEDSAFKRLFHTRLCPIENVLSTMWPLPQLRTGRKRSAKEEAT